MAYRQLLRPKILSGSDFRSRQLITSAYNHHGSNINSSPLNPHDFSDESQKSIEITNAQRIILSIGSSVAALLNPHR